MKYKAFTVLSLSLVLTRCNVTETLAIDVAVPKINISIHYYDLDMPAWNFCLLTSMRTTTTTPTTTTTTTAGTLLTAYNLHLEYIGFSLVS